jgi:menaquinone-specific isochorismate synthase
MTDLAFFRLPNGQAWLGKGPFTESAAMPQGTAFYWNDFDLSDPKPWKVPSQLHAIKSADDLLPFVGAASALHVLWEKPPTEGFKMAFRRIRREVLSARLQKMVPVLAERGRLNEGSPATLLHRVLSAPANLWGYGHLTGDQGFLGATPELLFQASGNTVQTMALAGTAKPGAGDAFLNDLKEIEEHEIVARFIIERLSSLGQVQRDERKVCETAGLRHFQSTISVTSAAAVDADALVRLLHPTPAVGCLPRDEEWLAKLREYRALLSVPGFFGAPFGFSHEGTQHMVVSIRGLAWQGEQLVLPSGCGIVGGSAFDHEAVVRLLGCS